MRDSLKVVKVILVVLPLFYLIGCGGGGGGESGVTDYSGTYYVDIASRPRSLMQINQSGDKVTFTLDTSLSITGEGSVNGDTMTLSGDADTGGTLNMSITFSEDGQSFSGTWDFVDSNGTITGTKTPWTTYDVEANGIPQFVSTYVIELQKISQISKFRSGIGHDYSDDFESCRSMKHYFVPKANVDKLSVKLFSPINGTVSGLTDDWTGNSVWKGTTVSIKSKNYPAFYIIIYHIDLINTLNVGDEVVEGQLLGYPADYPNNVTIADTAVGVITPIGYKLVSFFEVMSDSLFLDYQARGLNSRYDVIISKTARDADPLTCNGEEFLDSGNLVNWATLN